MVVSPFRYPGGKARIAPWIAGLLPPPGSYSTFVDVFGGAGNVTLEVMRRCREAGERPLFVFNDLDGDIVNFFRVLRDPAKRCELRELLRWTPFSRQQYIDCLNGETPPCSGEDVARAWWFFVVQQQSFAAAALPPTPGQWGYDLKGVAVRRWLNSQGAAGVLRRGLPAGAG